MDLGLQRSPGLKHPTLRGCAERLPVQRQRRSNGGVLAVAERRPEVVSPLQCGQPRPLQEGRVGNAGGNPTCPGVSPAP